MLDRNSLPKQIKVMAYSGYKANERPIYLILDNRKIEVQKVIERHCELEHDSFRILADDGKEYLVKWNRESDIWTLEGISEGKM